MGTLVETPTPDQECAYCGSRIFDHDPICVRDCTETCGDPEYFCNYACLLAHVDAEDRTAGAACEWRPDGP